MNEDCRSCRGTGLRSQHKLCPTSNGYGVVEAEREELAEASVTFSDALHRSTPCIYVMPTLVAAPGGARQGRGELAPALGEEQLEARDVLLYMVERAADELRRRGEPYTDSRLVTLALRM